MRILSPLSPPKGPASDSCLPWGAGLLTVLLLVLSVGGCSVTSGVRTTVRAPEYRACLRYLEGLEETVRSHGVSDRQHHPVAGFPYLRSDRFLASFAADGPRGAALDAWLDHMQEAALRGLHLELDNLPPGTDLPPTPLALPSEPHAATRYCSDVLRADDRRQENLAERLAEPVRVPGEYLRWQRAVGVYYLSLLAVQRGVDRWQGETLRDFATAPADLPVKGRLTAYLPPATTTGTDGEKDIGALLRALPRDALGIPLPDDEQREALFTAFAPTWVVDVASAADRPGRMEYAPDGKTTRTNPERPTVYRLLSHTRFHNEILLQLNYLLWFPERPADGRLDLLGGHLDGLIWRVTLDRDGQPLLFDSIHPCGCYHLFFPRAGLPTATHGGAFQEDTLVPGAAPKGNRARLHIAHATHYLQSAVDTSVPDEQQHYAFADYDELRSLPLLFGGRRSLFGPDGIVPGTQRGERFVLWPMGVPAPGAMRQWGHHATAFVGERHFDDPRLIETAFRADESEERE